MTREKVWWRVARRNERNKIIGIPYRAYAVTRKEAKELAAKHWELGAIDRLTAISDRSSYASPPDEALEASREREAFTS